MQEHCNMKCDCHSLWTWVCPKQLVFFASTLSISVALSYQCMNPDFMCAATRTWAWCVVTTLTTGTRGVTWRRRSPCCRDSVRKGRRPRRPQRFIRRAITCRRLYSASQGGGRCPAQREGEARGGFRAGVWDGGVRGGPGGGSRGGVWDRGKGRGPGVGPGLAQCGSKGMIWDGLEDGVQGWVQ